MARTIIDVPDDQLREVDNLCRLLGISRAEAVRRALHDFLRHNGDVNPDAFGLWKDSPGDQTPVRRRLQRLR
jgi:metal-responsive CopG/Arc/MetJ family transcriptional regulator